MKKLINWHKKLLEDIQKRFGISNYIFLWIAFIEGVVIGIIIGFAIA